MALVGGQRFAVGPRGPRRDQGQTPRGPCSAGGNSRGQQEANPSREGVSPSLGGGPEGPPAQGKRPQGVLSRLSLRQVFAAAASFSALLSALTETSPAISGEFPVRQQGGDGAIVPSGTSPTVLWLRPRTPSTGDAGEPWSGSLKATRSRMKQCPQSGCGCRWLPTTGGSAARSMGTASGSQIDGAPPRVVRQLDQWILQADRRSMAPHHGWFGSSINGNCKRIAGPLVLLGEPRGRGERRAGLGAAGWVSSRKRGPPTLHSCAASECRGARLVPGQGRAHQGRWDVPFWDQGS